MIRSDVEHHLCMAGWTKDHEGAFRKNIVWNSNSRNRELSIEHRIKVDDTSIFVDRRKSVNLSSWIFVDQGNFLDLKVLMSGKLCLRGKTIQGTRRLDVERKQRNPRDLKEFYQNV